MIVSEQQVVALLRPHPTDDILADICTEEFLALPHLEGTGRFINTDTDVELTGHGADASCFNISGTVADESGNRFHVTVVLRGLVALGSDLPDFDFIVHQFKFQLKPIGG